ncbi:hypothetical protein E9232_001322 [Inquilinus ginsengisoli]|uniref:Nucleoside 2-deoxyribosyltransferase n=1 Tax=Inquilinus ginsengisoli TaxID=363840 RepID=A0ABU1JJN9_9PROT|nr:hypothetical protein [Inquilinus ginsengisoli]MDR6288815.1 hypothetical protein [Inquilinus ginsengisoli]
MSDQKRACLIFVKATEGRRAAVRTRLEQNGYSVCEVEAELDDALAAQSGGSDLPAELIECISKSDLCVFLLPEAEANDGVLDDAAGLANNLGKRIVGIVSGDRIGYPQNLDDHAGSMIREGSDRFDDAVCGTDVWERPDRSPVVDRPIKHIRCQ